MRTDPNVRIVAGRVVLTMRAVGSMTWEDAYDLARLLQHAADRAKAEDDAMRAAWVAQRAAGR